MENNGKNILFFVILFICGVVANAQDKHGDRKLEGRVVVADSLLAHDPVMAYEDGVYYLFTTGHGLHYSTSTDLKTWKLGGAVLKETPKWLKELQSFCKGHLWAPDVIKYNGKWHLYYASSDFGKNTSIIGHLSCDKLSSGKWTDEGMVIQSVPHRDNWNAIDANVIVAEGEPYMCFGSFWGGIKMFKMNSELSKPAEPQQWYSLSSRPRQFRINAADAGRAAVEAPFITYVNGYYYLFVSFDYCCKGAESTYKVVVGRSKNVGGPYLDKDGNSMEFGGGSLVVEGDKVRYQAVGHCAVYNDMPCGSIFVSHAYDMKTGVPYVYIRSIDWSSGWPVLKDLQ